MLLNFTYAFFKDGKALRIDAKRDHRVEERLEEHVHLVAEAGEADVEAVVGALDVVLEAGELGRVRVLGERVAEQLDEQVAHVDVHRIEVDERIAQLELEHRFGQHELGVLLVPEASERRRLDDARMRFALGGRRRIRLDERQVGGYERVGQRQAESLLVQACVVQALELCAAQLGHLVLGAVPALGGVRLALVFLGDDGDAHLLRLQVVVHGLDERRIEAREEVVGREHALHLVYVHVGDERRDEVHRLLLVLEGERDLAQVVELVVDPGGRLLAPQHVQVLIDEHEYVVDVLAALLAQVGRQVEDLKAARLSIGARVQVIAPAASLQLAQQAAAALCTTLPTNTTIVTTTTTTRKSSKLLRFKDEPRGRRDD